MPHTVRTWPLMWVRGNPDMGMAISNGPILDFKTATTTIPIIGIFIGPVEAGIVSSLARSGGNITGVSGSVGLDLIEKRVRLLRRGRRMRVDFGYSHRARWETDGKPNGPKMLGCMGSPTFGAPLCR